MKSPLTYGNPGKGPSRRVGSGGAFLCRISFASTDPAELLRRLGYICHATFPYRSRFPWSYFSSIPYMLSKATMAGGAIPGGSLTIQPDWLLLDVLAKWKKLPQWEKILAIVEMAKTSLAILPLQNVCVWGGVSPREKRHISISSEEQVSNEEISVGGMWNILWR